MEVKVIVITFMLICLSVLLSPFSATAMQIQKLPRVHEQGLAEMILSLPQLPRKLRFLDEKQTSTSGEAQGSSSTSNKEKKDASSGGEAHQRMVMHGSNGTWQEWVEGSDTSNMFSMDYSHVKRRRPIHNKSLPVGP